MIPPQPLKLKKCPYCLKPGMRYKEDQRTGKKWFICCDDICKIGIPIEDYVNEMAQTINMTPSTR